MNIFDNIKSRGVKDILFLSMDGVSGLEDGVKSIFRRQLYKDALCTLYAMPVNMSLTRI